MESKSNKKTTDTSVQGNSMRPFKVMLFALIIVSGVFTSYPSFAHCDSYDGPVINDATKALQTNKPQLILKWVDKKQEAEILTLFEKTYNLKNGDKESYAIVEKHFFETLVRLHRETEGAPYSGLKPAGSTKAIVQMTDHAIKAESADELVLGLNAHIERVVREKYQKVSELNKVKDLSPEKGREYVKAYVDYTHTLEGIHDIIEHDGAGQAEHQH
jgi:hypothetical protein